MNEVDILRRLLEAASGPDEDGECSITTKKMDAILLECWGNKHDAGMHCNSMMRAGFIDYAGEGEWTIFVRREDLDQCDEAGESDGFHQERP